MPTVDGIVAEVSGSKVGTYDYWALRKDGRFYLLQSLFEDLRYPEGVNGRKPIFWDTQIQRVTEALLYCARLYSRLGEPKAAEVHVRLQYGGLRERVLTAVNPKRLPRIRGQTKQLGVTTEITAKPADIEAQIVEKVKELTQPLFILFSYHRVPDSAYADIVNGYVAGRAD